MSDDGKSALVVIMMLGNVFSPAYRAARLACARGAAAPNPLDFSTFNIALYTEHGGAWALTEHFASRVTRTRSSLHIGRSHATRDASRDATRDGCTMQLYLDEAQAHIAAPIGTTFGPRIVGTVQLEWPAFAAVDYALTASERHLWSPYAPHARATVHLTSPALTFTGHAYVDGNRGTEPLEQGFRRWSWSRATAAGGRTLVTYAAEDRAGQTQHIDLLFQRHSDAVVHTQVAQTAAITSMHLAPIPSTRFGLARGIWCDANSTPSTPRTLEDSPFYARTLVQAQCWGAPATVVHEELSLTRFTHPVMQFLLPFRMNNGRPSLRCPEFDQPKAPARLGPGPTR